MDADILPTTNSPLDSTSKQQNYLEFLPIEILLNIFLFLPYHDRVQMKLVCRRMYHVTSDPHLWREITWSNFSTSDEASVRNILGQYSNFLTSFRVTGQFSVTKFSEQLSDCSNINSLVLIGMKQTISEIERLLKNIRSLSHLTFEPCNKQCDILHCNHLMCGAHEWRDFLRASSNLTSLTLVTPWNDHIVEFLLREWSSLNYYPLEFQLSIIACGVSVDLWYTRCVKLLELWKELQTTFPGCSHAAKFCVNSYKPQLFSIKPPLFELHLNGKFLTSAVTASRLEATEADLGGVIWLCGKHKKLEQFACGHYIPDDLFPFSSSDAAYGSFPFYANSITCLNFYGASRLLPIHLEIVANSCSSLAELNIENCELSLSPLSGLSAVACRCMKLTALNIQGIPSTAVENTEDVWQTLSMMQRLTHLATAPCLMLTQQSTVRPHTVLKTGDSSLEMSSHSSKSVVCQACQYMHLHCCPPRLSLLRHVRFTDLSPQLTSIMISTVLANCKYLNTLYVASEFTFQLSFEALNRTNLQQLCIKCHRMNITDTTVDSLAKNKLTHLYLFIRSISKASMLKVVQNFPHLVSCHIYTRDRPVMRPPAAVLEFRRTIRRLLEMKVPRLDDFVFEEDTMSRGWMKSSTSRSILSSNLTSVWL